jgi:hypothetical protein
MAKSKGAPTMLLRPIVDASAQERLRDVILDAYREHEAAVEAASA